MATKQLPKKKNVKRRKPKESGPLLSHTSVLILSAFLIGRGSGLLVQPGIQLYIFLAGIVGVLAYLGLGHLSRLRHERAALLACRRAVSKLESRADRIILRETPVRKRRPFEVPSVRLQTEKQYLTVVQSQSCPFR